MTTSKVERLMHLVIALLSTRSYLSAEQIRANVTGYQDPPTDEAFSRMFERDKNELRDLGIDVGRHNALDKLAGALACDKIVASDGIVLVTSRVSVEMVQKTAAIGAPQIAAVSAPTALAVRMADAAGITLAAIARADGFEIFTHPERVTGVVPGKESAYVVVA